MKTIWRVLIGLLVIMTLVGCGTANSDTSSDEQVSTETSQGVHLRDDYADALSIQGQLAAGTLLLEETELVVDEAMAAELLPLWRAAQSLINSDTAAVLEIEAVYNQIQDSMTPDQISTIAEMELTEETLTTMMEEGELSLGQGGFTGGRGQLEPLWSSRVTGSVVVLGGAVVGVGNNDDGPLGNRSSFHQESGGQRSAAVPHSAPRWLWWTPHRGHRG